MNRQLEDRLRAALDAKASQVTDERLTRLADQRARELFEGIEAAGGPITQLEVNRPALRETRQARWFPPALAAAAVAALAVGITAISAAGHRSDSRPNPPASQISTPAPTVTGAPSHTTAPSQTTPPPSASPAPSGTQVAPVQLSHGQQAGRSAIPWDQVGPGWTVALWTASTKPDPRIEDGLIRYTTESFYLVNPVGGRYLIATLPAGKWQLSDWSGDRHRALLLRTLPGPVTTSALAEVDLGTGRLGPEVNLGVAADTVTYTKPSGAAILVTSRSGVERIRPSGAVELKYPRSLPGLGILQDPLYSPDGLNLVFHTTNGLALLANNGRLIRAFPRMASAFYCTPVRWTTPAVVLVSCFAPSGGNQLWAFPIDGSAPVRVAASATGEPWDAVTMPAGTFIDTSSSGAPCVGDISQRQADGSYRRLDLQPKVRNFHADLIGASATALELRSTTSCSVGAALLSYTPTTGKVASLLGGTLNGGTVLGSVLYGQTDPLN